ncbi:molecular chaperone, partial [Klebsiella pneumoniae]
MSYLFLSCTENFLLGLAFASSVAAPAAQAEIVIHGTRVIYPSDAREV